MAHGESTGSRRRSWLRRLDYLPPRVAVAVGLGAGAVLGAVLTAGGSIAGAAIFLVALGLTAGLAFSGEPVAVLEAVEPEQGGVN